ncbi:MAG: hypothetical protein A3F10_03080, partial [Coxiella sp. RIFCSPHIGHO2_12_FULL_42_15]
MKDMHAQSTKGRWYGHIFRRLVHVSMLLIPLVYYAYGESIAGFFSLSTHFFLLILLVVVMLVECLRLRLGLVIFGQRRHEARHISSFSWGMIGILLVLLISPSRSFSIPIIWCLALVDPLLGELRHLMKRVIEIEIIGVAASLAIWWICGSWWLGLSPWWGVFMAPLTIVAEWIQLKWIDDNALMLLIPLAVIKVVEQFM